VRILAKSCLIEKNKKRRRVLTYPRPTFVQKIDKMEQNLKLRLLKNKPMPVIGEPENFKDAIELLEKFFSLCKQRNNGEISTSELFAYTKELITSNLHFPLIRRIHELQFSTVDTYLFLYLIWKTITGDESTDLGRATEGIFKNQYERVNYVQKILSNDNELIKQNYIKIVEASFFSDSEMKLTETSAKMLQEFGLKLNL
jgi:hypothetical protein